MKRLLLVALLLCVSASAQMWPFPGPGAPTVAAPPALPFSDTFSGSGALGANWSVWEATAGTPVRNNGFSSNAWGAAAVKLIGLSIPNNQWAELKIDSLATSQGVRLFARLTATSTSAFTGYSVNFQPDGAAITLGKCTNSLSCAWMASCGTVTAGHTYRIVATGSTISVNDNGTQACTATDSGYASGTVGLEVTCSGTCPAVVNFQAD